MNNKKLQYVKGYNNYKCSIFPSKPAEPIVTLGRKSAVLFCCRLEKIVTLVMIHAV